VAGIYAKRGACAIAGHVLPGTEKIVFGKKGGMQELLYAGTGFLLTRRQVYLDIEKTEQLVTVNKRWGKGYVPYFMPMIVPDGDEHWYLADDFSFCERARRADYKIMTDTTVRLIHIGEYDYSWENTGAELSRYSNFTLTLT
jgi:hypothetical protein